MIRRYLLRDVRVRAGVVACVAALATLTWVAGASIRVDAAPARLSGTPSRVVAAGGRLDTTSDALVSRAIDRDPFAVASSAVQARESSPAPATRAVAQPLRLVGTVVDGASGDFALCQLGADAPKVVRVGQTIGTYTLRSITQGAAAFDSPAGDRVELRVSKSGT